MADIGNLAFSVHLKDFTDAEAANIKKKLENLSVKLNIDAGSTKVSNIDSIKKQIEDAVKSIHIASVKVDANAVKSQIESATQNVTPKVSVSLQKGNLPNDIQAYLDTKSFPIKITISRSSLNEAVKNLGNVSVPVQVKVSSKAVLSELRKDLKAASVLLSVKAKSSAELLKDIREKLKGKDVKIDVGVNKSNVRKSVVDALKGKTFQADLKLTVKSSSVQEAIQQAFAKAGLKYNTSASDLRAQKIAEIQQRMAMRAANANRNLANSYHQAARGSDQFARASATLSGGLHTNIRLGGQLGTVLGNLASVIGLKDVLQDVIAIGGQLENQRIALGSILQDGGKATAMFSKIQSLAVKSPFGIMDLNQYVKQLSAYQVPYNELYDTMKRLADISAGVGVDMGRIILAFGQVKAAGFLKGTELRQFTEANIPMVKALADRFTELRGEIVSAAEVYDMISKKQITFEDVKSVLWDLTDEGGMFNNMQEVLSESLASKWKNLADAIDVMYGKMADGTMGSMLKGVAEILTNLTHQWQFIASGIATATAAFITHKIAVVAGSKQIASASSAYNSLLMNKRQQADALEQEAIFRKLKKSEQGIIDTKNKLTKADVKAAIAAGQLNKQQALTLVAMKKLDPALLRGQQRLLGLSTAELRAAQNTTKFQIAITNLGISLRNFGYALKGMFLNPWFLATTAITGLVEVFTYFNKKSEESDQRIKDSFQAATEGYRNLSNALDEAEGTPNTDAGLISGIEKMTTTLKDYAANWAEILGKIYEKDESGDYVNDLETRYDLLKEKLLQTKEAYELLTKSMSGFSESANDATDGVWDESLIENLKDLSESSSEYNKYLNAMTRNSFLYKDAIEAAAKADEKFANAIVGKDFREQIDLLKDYEEATNAFSDYLYDNTHITTYRQFNKFRVTFDGFKEDLKTAEEDIAIFAKAYKELLKGIGIDVNNLKEEEKIAIGVNLTDFIDKIEGLDEETKKLFYQRVLEKEFKIEVTAEYNEGVNKERWRSELIKAAGGEKLEEVVEVTIKAASDYESVVEEVRKMYKEANEVVDDLSPVLLKAQVKFESGKEVEEDNVIFWGLDKETQKAVKEWNKAVRQIKAAQNIANDQGFLLTEGKNGGSGKDFVAEIWKKRIEEIEKAVKMYDQWKKVEGKINAEERVKSKDELRNLFNGAYGFVLNLEKPTPFYEYIQSKLDESKDEQKKLKVNVGVKISDADLKDAQDKLKDFLEETKDWVSAESEKWSLFKELFEATGDRSLSMNIAFGGDVGFGKQIEQIKSRIIQEISKSGETITFEELIGLTENQLEERGLAHLKSLVDSYNKESKKLSDESIMNFARIIEASKDFEQKIADIDRKLQKDLADLSSVYQKDTPEYKRAYDELIRRAEEDKTKIRFEEFKKSSDWVKVFDDLDRVSNATLDEMTSKIAEFAKQAHLSEEVTKQLVEAMGKLRDEAIERNPLEGFKDAWSRRKYYQSLKGRVGEYDEDGKLITQKMIDDGLAEANEDLKDSSLAVANKFQAVANAADLLGGLFENLGVDLGGISDLFGGAASGAQTGAGIASAFGLSGPWGAVAGAAVGMLSSVFAMHDKALQREIEASEAREKAISNIASNLERLLERTMGGINTIGIDGDTKAYFEETLSRYSKLLSAIDLYNKEGVSTREGYEAYLQIRKIANYSEDTINTIREAMSEGSYYDAQLAALKARRDEVNHQMDLEENDKNKNASKIEDYKQEIRELNDEIENFARDMAEKLYGIDFKDWANQLAESLVNAWATGEDAVLAYKNTVTDILRDLGVSIISQKIIEPMLNDTMEQFLAQFAKDNGVLTDSSMKILSGMYDQAEYAASATESYLEGLKKMGIDISDTSKETSGGLSKGIESVTEDTANLLASYLNAIRQDVSIKRTLIEQLIVEDIPQMSIIAQAQLAQLNIIAANTLRNADAADRIYDLVNRVVDKSGNRLKV